MVFRYLPDAFVYCVLTSILLNGLPVLGSIPVIIDGLFMPIRVIFTAEAGLPSGTRNTPMPGSLPSTLILLPVMTNWLPGT